MRNLFIAVALFLLSACANAGIPYTFATMPAGNVSASTLDANFAYLNNYAKVSLLNFAGADPTGTTDSTAAFQAAINYVQALPNGGTIITGGGTFKLSPNVLTLQIDKVGIDSDGAIFNFVGMSATDIAIKITHSSSTIFPAFPPFVLSGFVLQSATSAGVAINVTGTGVNKFAAYLKLDRLNVKNWTVGLQFGNYSFAPVVTNSSFAAVGQVAQIVGTISVGAHYVFKDCLFTTDGVAGTTPVFDVGGITTWEFIACDFESSNYTLFTSSGSDVTITHSHFELDTGTAGANAALFVITNASYGSYVIADCNGFLWQSTANQPPFLGVAGSGMFQFTVKDSRIILSNGVATTNSTYNSTYVHPFIAYPVINAKNFRTDAQGQQPLATAQNNNSLSNWDFSGALSLDWTTYSGAPSITTAVPFGTGHSVHLPGSTLITDTLTVPDNTSQILFNWWQRITNSGVLTVSILQLDSHGNILSTTPVNIATGLNVWGQEYTEAGLVLLNKHVKSIQVVFSTDATCVADVAYPFVDFL